MEQETEWKALDCHVLAVAKQGTAGHDWAAYIGAVKGEDHLQEWPDVLRNGAKLKKEVAEAIFPRWVTKYTWRY